VSCLIGLIQPVFVVRWLEPQLADLRRIDRELTEAVAVHGGPIVYVAIVPLDTTPPDDEMRAEFSRTMSDVLRRCDTMHFVMEGQGFKQAILRSALATIFLISRSQRSKVFVHSTLEDALIAANDRASKNSKFSPSSMMRQADEAGLVTASKAITSDFNELKEAYRRKAK
jgi:hypothetical protein